MRFIVLSRKLTAFLIAAIFILITIGIFITASDVICGICSSEIDADINDIINESNDVVLALKSFGEKYFNYEYTDDGKLTAIYPNTGLINQITLLWSTEIQNRLNELRALKIELPAGVFTGSALLAQFGVEIFVTARVVSSCNIRYKSEFIKSGINQTLHRFVLYTDVNADIIVPRHAEDIFVTQEIVLAETIIVGDVPDSYLIGDSSCDYLDLLP